MGCHVWRWASLGLYKTYSFTTSDVARPSYTLFVNSSDSSSHTCPLTGTSVISNTRIIEFVVCSVIGCVSPHSLRVALKKTMHALYYRLYLANTVVWTSHELRTPICQQMARSSILQCSGVHSYVIDGTVRLLKGLKVEWCRQSIKSPLATHVNKLPRHGLKTIFAWEYAHRAMVLNIYILAPFPYPHTQFFFLNHLRPHPQIP